MGKQTALYAKHLEAKANLVNFNGWDMPVDYGSATQEHHAVREQAGVFDISYQTIIDLAGIDAQAFLQRVLANNVAQLSETGQALYSPLLNHSGGVIDSLMVYSLSNGWRMVLNSNTREKTLEWLAVQSKHYEITLSERPDLALLAVQGPQALSKAKLAAADFAGIIDALAPFQSQNKGQWMIARSGYSGEDGLEIFLPNEQAAQLWQALLDNQVQPCGLSARNSLRLEAGLDCYGQDLDESHSPLNSGLSAFVAWEPSDRDFIGRSALSAEIATGVTYKQVGLVLDEPSAIAQGQEPVITEAGNGLITSGTFSPTLQQSIAIARVPVATKQTTCVVEIAGKRIRASIITLPFVRNGQKQF